MRGGQVANAFDKEIVRSITKSIGRFAAIAIISLLGAGFYAGLRMGAPDMRIAGDDFFDGASFYDISVMTTLGLDDESLALLGDVEGVGEVMPAYRADAMALVGSNSYAARIESFPVDAARASDSSDGATVKSDDEGYLNRLILEEGTWPVERNECVVDAYVAADLDISLGDELTLEKGTTDLEDTFAVRRLTVVGFVNSPAYASIDQLGATSLGTGSIELYAYVPESAFDEDLPYTVAYLTVPDARDKQWETDEYGEAVCAVRDRVDNKADDIARARWNAVKAEAQEELDDARQEYEDERADAERELDDAFQELSDAQFQLSDAQGDLAAAKDDLDRAREKLQDAYDQLAASRAELNAANAQLNELYQQLENLKALIDAGMADEQVIAQYQYMLGLYEQGLGQYTQGEAQYAAGVEQYEAGLAQYEEGLAKYEEGVAEYESGVRDYEGGASDYESGRLEAEEGFADAEEELADAQKDIDDIEYPDVYVMDRTKNYGAAQLASDADGIAQIATFLPFMFFLVAALVVLTSMTRMVDEERMLVGTHKALGYSRGRIISKYLIYGVLASGVGSIIGVLFFGVVLPLIIMVAYQVAYAVPTTPTPIDLSVTAKAVGLSVGVTAVVTWIVAAATLRERPSALMLPRVPKAGKRVFLEHITPLWSRMSFSHKVTARNLLRYKRRFFMAVVGIAGCTALLVIGFGLRDVIGSIVTDQFGELMSYDAAVRVDEDIEPAQRDQVLEVLDSPMVEAHLEVADFNMIGSGSDGDLRVEVVVPEDPDALASFVTLRDRVSGEALALDADEVVITEKAANELGAQVGDEVTLFDENDVGDAVGEGRTFTIGGIAENYLGHYVYMLPEGYRAEFGDDPTYDLSYVRLAEGADEDVFSNVLLDIEGVNTVGFSVDKMRTYQDMLDLMTSIIAVVIVLSAALAFVVLYNLTNINITERVREIATLKVLGFTRAESNAYIFREIIVMVAIGALVGCVIGLPLTLYIAQAAETPQMMFGRVIQPLSYVFSFVITMLFSGIVAFTMRGKLAKVDMVESLKSIE